MKIREFSPEAQKVIEDICVFSPQDQTDDELYKKIEKRVSAYQHFLKPSSCIIDKHWRDKRNELSVFYTYGLDVFKTEENTGLDALGRFKKIKSGEALRDPRFVTEGLKYGIVSLTADEIRSLVQNNTFNV